MAADKRYADVVTAAMTKVLGPEGARAMLFYTGEPHPSDFQQKLRKILGPGAEVIFHEMASQAGGAKR